jgi:hypothetical protein
MYGGIEMIYRMLLGCSKINNAGITAQDCTDVIGLEQH